MNRIILGMVVVNYLMVAVTAYLGMLSNPDADSLSLTDDMFRYHFRLGLFTGLYTLLVHCIVFTYFLGTNRWVRETSAAYRLSDEFARVSRSCRAKAFMVALVSMLLVVAAIATGAGAHTRTWPKWVHQTVPMLTYAFMLYAYWIEYLAVERHMGLTDEVMDEVNRIRRERGLETL